MKTRVGSYMWRQAWVGRAHRGAGRATRDGATSRQIGQESQQRDTMAPLGRKSSEAPWVSRAAAGSSQHSTRQVPHPAFHSSSSASSMAKSSRSTLGALGSVACSANTRPNCSSYASSSGTVSSTTSVRGMLTHISA